MTTTLSHRLATTVGALALLALIAGPVSSPAAAAAPPRAAEEDQPGRMILVLDSSGSMKEPAAGGVSKIAAARSALTSVVADLPADAQVGMRVFGARVFSRTDKGACTDSQLVVKPGTDNRADLRKAVTAYKPYGETPIGYALRQAAKDIGGEGKRSIVLVSDGEATCKPDPCLVARELAAAGIDLRIDVVGLSVSGNARRQLQCIAQQGNGSYYDVDSADEITRSLTRVAERAVRPFTVTGRPIEGAPSTEEPPTPITEGDWTDKLGPKSSSRGSLYYAYDRRWAGSTIRVSAVTPGDVGEWDGVEVEATPMTTPDASSCDTHIDYRDIDTTSVVGSEVVVADDDPESDCARKGKFRIRVSRWLDAPAQVPVAIRVSEEPPVSDTGTAPSSPEPEVRLATAPGPAKPVLGGSSFSDATEVGNGRFSGTIVPGEAQMFRVPLTFGQHAQVRFHFPQATAAVREKTGYQGPFLTMRLYNPMRAALDSADGAHDTETLPGAEAVDVADATPVVSRATPIDDGHDASLAGSYYVGISVAHTDSTYEVPYTLHVQVVDGDGTSPTHKHVAGWTVDSSLAAVDPHRSTPEKATGSTKAPAPTDTRSRSGGGLATPVKVAAAGALVLVALACIGGAVLYVRRSPG